MPVEGPADTRNEFFGHRFGNVMKQGCPPQPDIIAPGCHVIEYLERMMEVILMTLSLLILDTPEP